ncbi:MAG: 23S rRNA (adenine(2503)-C(2))-methyltransferase RlmN [Muribaculaceae bacterium]|nr:23S rRNA (adenine(2503)-C(2))-methyltransferase RlmN [Roseburia sp.]MCM1430287.1 23S rRNA (adenine(2503)-C(2))-methyltransferase RlmN [Muribaculaceae bacterium]MCM1492604.1 23S rRNA (adenine(2503)-C(2))-methyltransferase RlmN [Muribaculaceae bacterium]
MEKPDVRSMTMEELTEFIVKTGEKPFRAKQLYEWLHLRGAADFSEMTNLSKELRRRLMQEAKLVVLKQEAVQISALDGTRKYLFALEDGSVIESVFMRYRHGNSVCISSQAGCRMGCRFCASTLDGLARNLAPSEMLEQVYRIAKDVGERISHVVVMGTGEPLDNYDNLLRFLKLLTDGQGVNISQRNVTVSTCGLVEEIKKLAQEKLAITLALSLHAGSQEKRLELMPVAKRYPLSEVLEACRYYFEQTGRRITFEYSLIEHVNDSREDAQMLAGLLSGMNCHVNLIPVNPVRERSYARPETGVVESFRGVLEQKGIPVTVRRELGSDIDGACGQLRRKYTQEKA